MVALETQLKAATSLIDLVRRLGATCLREEALLTQIMSETAVAPQLRYAEALAAKLDISAFNDPGKGFLHIIDVELGDQLELLATRHPLEQLALLRGLCRGPLLAFFDSTEAQVPLTTGMAIPYATRPIQLVLAKQTTPHRPTLEYGQLLHGVGFELFRHKAGHVEAVLDFTYRDRLDELTWSRTNRLPEVATFHAYLGEEALDIPFTGPDRFFGVRPTRFDAEELSRQLQAVRTVPIAVLAELSLPAPDAIEPMLAAKPSSYPPLVVAGSAHLHTTGPDGQPVRANESRVYLDGRLVMQHRKIHPLRTTKIGKQQFDRPAEEDLTREPKRLVVLASDHTRLAVVICADLNDGQVPHLLEAAGVNLLLVPALTYNPGAFNGTVCLLASERQGVSVIVNAELDPFTPLSGDEVAPFFVIAALPIADPNEQSGAFRPDARPLHGLVDPNQPLADAVNWEPRSDVS